MPPSHAVAPTAELHPLRVMLAMHVAGKSVLPCSVLPSGATFRTPGFLQGVRNCEHEMLAGSFPSQLSVGARELGRSLTEMTC